MRKLDTPEEVKEALTEYDPKEELKESIANMMVFWLLATRHDLQEAVFTKDTKAAAAEFPEVLRTNTEELSDIIDKIKENKEQLYAVFGTLELYADKFWWTRRTYCVPSFIADEMLKAAITFVDEKL